LFYTILQKAKTKSTKEICSYFENLSNGGEGKDWIGASSLAAMAKKEVLVN
jgi:hypothetical protein